MTNKPMLSIERESVRELWVMLSNDSSIEDGSVYGDIRAELHAILNADKVNSRGMGLMQYAQHKGEAVAIVTGSAVQWLPGAGKLKDRSPLYAEQPALVMPERKTYIFSSSDETSEEGVRQYNKALEDIAKLNGLKP